MEITMETAVINKMRLLPAYRKHEVLNFVEFLLSKLVTTVPSQDEQLAAAAKALLSDYESDSDLTAFTILDGEEFYA